MSREGLDEQFNRFLEMLLGFRDRLSPRMTASKSWDISMISTLIWFNNDAECGLFHIT